MGTYYATRSTALTKQLAEALRVERDGFERVRGAQDLIQKKHIYFALHVMMRVRLMYYLLMKHIVSKLNRTIKQMAL